jgi:hypothetical protein
LIGRNDSADERLFSWLQARAKWITTMALYRVRFLKTVCDATGHEHQICQSAIDVEAESNEAAIARAERLFASRNGACDWRFYVDRVHVDRSEATSASRRREKVKVPERRIA